MFQELFNSFKIHLLEKSIDFGRVLSSTHASHTTANHYPIFSNIVGGFFSSYSLILGVLYFVNPTEKYTQFTHQHTHTHTSTHFDEGNK